MFLKNRNIISKIKISKVTDYAALSFDQPAQGTVIYVSHSVALMQFQEIKKKQFSMGAQWLNIRVFDPRPIQAVASSSITGVTVLCP